MARSKAFALIFFLGLVSLASSPATASTESDFFYLTLMGYGVALYVVQKEGEVFEGSSRTWGSTKQDLQEILSTMWPGSYCNSDLLSKCCRPTTGKPALDFFVQALETYNSITGEPVTRCNTTECRFSVNALRKLIDDLYAYWTDVSCPSNNGRQQWEDVWCTYGTCSNLNQTYYFQRALALRAQVDLLSILESNGIVPSSTNSYKLEDIQGALDKSLGSSSTVVECNQKWILGDYQLYKIQICVSSDTMSIISCPINKSSNCGSKVKFPPFDPKSLPIGSANNMADLIKMPAAIDMDM